MSNYRATIGLEVHAELKTKTKMFCGCRNDPNEKRPNINICPVCMAHPGTLPVINRDAMHKVLMVGTALGSNLASFSEFDRKNYFYPDIPKGYQISQFAYPLVQGGTLSGVAITRIHLEEDTARSQHEAENSLLDFNRAGVPLMELVTEPVIHTAEDASAFARELQLLLRYLGSGDANMEKGEMRVEANISVSTDDIFGTKVEIKNINSFRSVERAIAYEISRQTELLESGGKVVQETRGWDDAKQLTFSQRKKESSHDYRYFPDPDLPKLNIFEITEFSLAILQDKLPQLPWEHRNTYINMGLKPDDANMFTRDRILGSFFDISTINLSQEGVLIAANYIVSDIAGKIENAEINSSWIVNMANAERFEKLIHLIQSKILSSRGAKDTLSLMFITNDDPEEIAKANGLIQQSDEGVLIEVARKIIEAHPDVVASYRAGKVTAIQFLVGQGMKETKGSANPEALRAYITDVIAQTS